MHNFKTEAKLYVSFCPQKLAKMHDVQWVPSYVLMKQSYMTEVCLLVMAFNFPALVLIYS